jgi:hypothetical protein
MAQIDQPEPPGREFWLAGADIVGSGASATAGLIFGGPAGALAGAALGPAVTRCIKWVADEYGGRRLGRRERARMGAVLHHIAERIEQLNNEGYQVRDDGFFDDTPDGRNVAREVLEGVLLTARNSYEERKLRHLGYLFANLAHSRHDPGLCNHMIGLAEVLTWRQYVLVAAVANNKMKPLPKGKIDDNPGAWASWGLRLELSSLYTQRIIGAPDKLTDPHRLPYTRWIQPVVATP